MPPQKHIPARTCIVCGNKTDKRELVRIVASPNSAVVADPTGKSAGRGAYICRNDALFPQKLKRGKLEHALRTSIKEEDWVELQNSLQSVAAE